MSSDPSFRSELSDRYTLLEKLGEGGFGVVYKATQQATGQHVAIKMLRGDIFEGPHAKEHRDRFAREMKLIGRMSSPHLVRLLDAGFDGEQPFMALEYIRGVELSQVIERGPMRPGLVRLVADNVLRALAEAHDQGIVHRDLKPQNVMLIGNGLRASAKVLDFGIAGIQQSMRAAGEAQITQHGQFRGTPAYMAPELFEKFGQAQPQSDVYAMGLILNECLTGESLITGDSVLEMYHAHIAHRWTLEPWVASSPFGPIITKACARWPEERYGSADQMLEAVHSMSGTLSMSWSYEAGDYTTSVPLGAGMIARAQRAALPVMDFNVDVLDFFDEDVSTVTDMDSDVAVQALGLAQTAVVAGQEAQKLRIGLGDKKHADTITDGLAPHSGAEAAEAVSATPAPSWRRELLFVAVAAVVVAVIGAAVPSLTDTRAEPPAAESTEQREGQPRLPPEAAASEGVLSLLEGLKHAVNGEPQAAVDAFAVALQYDPHSSAAHNGMGWALVALNRHEEAESHFLAIRMADEYASSALAGLVEVRYAGESYDDVQRLAAEYLGRFPSGPRQADVQTKAAEARRRSRLGTTSAEMHGGRPP